jgi:hypothetical protein
MCHADQAGGEYGVHVSVDPGVTMRTQAGEPDALRAVGVQALVVLTVNTYPQS